VRFTLRDLGYPYKSICQGRKQVGRVWKNTEGTFTGKIGQDERTGATSEEAFRNVAATALGYDSVEALRSHNAQVRHANKQRRNDTRRIIDNVLRGDFDALDQLLGVKR
jgi:hypothetical protein